MKLNVKLYDCKICISEDSHDHIFYAGPQASHHLLSHYRIIEDH